MTIEHVLEPASGCRIVKSGKETILFSQPPEVLKGLLLNKIDNFDTLVLTDIREKHGSLTCNLEFPLYFFLFVANGYKEERKLKLVGHQRDITHALRLLRTTLLGPTESELKRWGTEVNLSKEWLAVSRELALKTPRGGIIEIEEFFEIIPFKNSIANTGALRIQRLADDQYLVVDKDNSVEVDLSKDTKIEPSYKVQSDYTPGGLVKMGLEVLGGASGFTLDEPCTGLALCYNGDYILIDSSPFLDQNLFARGIAKNQISAVFLTHLHDDHCSMFPLMNMPHRVDVITTKEIFQMAMEKLACGLGWVPKVVEEHFNLIEVTVGKRINYYGLYIKPHVTVHSIPTIGASFATKYKGLYRKLCVVGDNNQMSSVRELNRFGIVRDSTLECLETVYEEDWNLLIADGGAGAIHGDPADAIISKAERVVFVHVDELPSEFTNTFSLASSGKRYTIIEGDGSIYTSQINHYLTKWLSEPFPNRWMRSLLAEEEIRRYNQGDVIIVQNTDSSGNVYLVLTGYCDVVSHDGEKSTMVAKLQAGDVLGEMAAVSGGGVRNASVVAASPATVCVFSEETFNSFVAHQEFGAKLLARWKLRPHIKRLPQFSNLSSTAKEQVGNKAKLLELPRGKQVPAVKGQWFIFSEGLGTFVDSKGESHKLAEGDEFGGCPLSGMKGGTLVCDNDIKLVVFDAADIKKLRLDIPNLNYALRKYRVSQGESKIDWLLGEVSVLEPIS